MVALIIGGVQVAAAENIHQFALSEDCKKFAYIVQDKIGDYLYFNGEKSDRYDRIENPTYSPDGKHFAYTTIRGNTVSLVKDGVLQKDQYISVFSLMYSKDSRHLSYVADKIVNNVLHESVWVDGEKYGDYDEIKTPVFSPDNKHILYVGREISHEYAHLVLDNDELATVSGLFDSLGFAQFSPNGRHAIVQVMHYRSKDDFDHSIYFGSAIGRLWHSKDHEKILSSTVTFSKDGNFVEYAAQSGRKLLWVTERIPK